LSDFPESKTNLASPSPIIEVSHLTKRFVKEKDLAAVNDVSFTVGREVVSLFGPSGCGKTTTLRCIAGLERPNSGEISIDGKLVTSTSKKIFVSPEKRDIGLVFQSYALWPHMKVFDNIAYPLKIRRAPKEEIKERVHRVLSLVGLEGFENRYPAQLSGGQQQRVALARSLIYEPKVLLMDEPLSNLDAKVRERTREELKKLLSRIGIASVYVTHDQEEAFVLSDRILVMSDGKIVQADVPFNIYQNPTNEFVASFVGRSNILDGIVHSKDGNTGFVKIFGLYSIGCELQSDLNVGDDCCVIIRSNEIDFLRGSPEAKNLIPCEIQAREYKGAVTDYTVKVGSGTLIVTTNDLRGTQLEEDPQANRVFLELREGCVSVIPKTQMSKP
jgi:iron(III) transport system ATP-binding protein